VGRTASADSLSRGSVALEGRAFEPDDEEETEDFGVGLTTRLEINYDVGSRFNAVASGLARLDALDETRNIATPEDLYGGLTAGPITLRLGFQVLNWTVTEAFHPADIINSRNNDSDAENPEKIGEPMLEFRLRLFNGYIDTFFMPARLPPKLPGDRSRLSPLSANPFGLALGEALWVERDGSLSDSYFAPQGAIRINQTIGKADIAIHLVDHNDRTHPTFTLDTTDGLARPTYFTVTQGGLTYTQVIGSLIVKFEGVYRKYRDADPDVEVGTPFMEVDNQHDHGQVVGGVEYGWTTEAGHDATIILEGTGILLKNRDDAKSLDVLQGDALIAYRHAFNDVRGKELRIGLLADYERPLA